MTKYIGFCLTILLLLLGFYFYQNNLDNERQTLSYDDEQEGLEKQITIHFSHVVAENTPKGLAAQKFAELVSEKTNGQVQVHIFQNGILYSDDDEYEALQRGDIEMIAPSFSKMIDTVPEWKVLDLPFIFNRNSQVEAVLAGQTSDHLLSMIKDKKVKGLSFWSNGFKQMTSDGTPLLEPEHFRGQTFRVMPGPVIEEQFRLLNARTVVMPFTEVYQGLGTREIDGQENTISNIYSKRLYRVQKHLTISNHGYLAYAVMVNQKFWNGLPEDIQEKIQEAMRETTLWNMKEAAKMNELQLQDIKENSTIQMYRLTEQQKKEWLQTFQPLYREVEEEVGRDLIELIQSPPDEER
ncbi:DctP family TRAP transporter solute-binding subunit [Domibacillus epiphyticus]|uniref:C4-dicarboxylate ABC transporter n=1 Tax=Domibacillus epiphyticus TaxID=1714355 RepID=A0A1V2A518_9BACI|nr:DctP family TRAP transporter solute-binding subunit [Domibacillus epiphyticus]OMP66027.1 C4-dicarboxylate ABC transporter [Domibacillus epiphyticus]